MSGERDVGLRAVGAAARFCEVVRAELVVGTDARALAKQDRSPVTVADFGAQALVCRLIRERYPHDVIVAEEDSAALRQPENANHLTSVTRFVGMQGLAASPATICRWIDWGNGTPGDRFWVLDPIDGTKGFLRQDQYAIALALIEDGAVQWGFLACPLLPSAAGTGLIFVAQRGGGTECLTLEGRSLGAVRVSAMTDATRARLVESVEAAHTNRELAGQLQAALGSSVESLQMDSQAKYAAVAGGHADLYLRAPNPSTPDYREHLWDHAAGVLLVHEAGGTVTDVYGAALDWGQGRRLETNIGVVATNGYLHNTVLDALTRLLPARQSLATRDARS